MHPPRRRGLGSADGSGRAGAQNNVALFCGPRNNFWLFCGPQNTHQVVLRHRRFVLWRVRLCAGAEVGRRAGARRVLGLSARTPSHLTCAHVRRRGVSQKKTDPNPDDLRMVCARERGPVCAPGCALCGQVTALVRCGVVCVAEREWRSGLGPAWAGSGRTCVHPPPGQGWSEVENQDWSEQPRTSYSGPASAGRADDTWLILPVVICLSQRLSHASVSASEIVQ